jgi:hypothetical protein
MGEACPNAVRARSKAVEESILTQGVATAKRPWNSTQNNTPRKLIAGFFALFIPMPYMILEP